MLQRMLETCYFQRRLVEKFEEFPLLENHLNQSVFIFMNFCTIRVACSVKKYSKFQPAVLTFHLILIG